MFLNIEKSDKERSQKWLVNTDPDYGRFNTIPTDFEHLVSKIIITQRIVWSELRMYSTLSPDNTINANTNNEPSVLKFEFETRQTDTFQCEEQTLLRIKNEITAENESKKNSTEILQDEEAEVTNGGWAWFIIMGALTLRIIVGKIFFLA